MSMLIDAYRFGGGGGATEHLPVSFSQSSIYAGGLEATTTNMRDGDFTTGAATSFSSEWIEADLGSPKLVNSIQVAGGSLPGWGGVSAYLNGRGVQYYDDGTTSWVSVPGTISGASDSPPYVTSFPVGGITAQRWRILSGTYLSTTEFRFFG